MLTKETKKRIDDTRDILVGVLPLPSDQIELITIALMYKFMDDQDETLRALDYEPSFFTGDLKPYAWKNLISNQLSADARVELFAKAIEAIAKAENVPTLFKNIFTNRFLKFRNGNVLFLFLKNINGFSYEHSEELGNAFEYLLMTMGAQGANGQFRTPRHIIDFIVEVVDPSLGDKILDPACGTGGFLISAVKHILRKNTEGYENYRLSLKNHDVEDKTIDWGNKLSNLEKDKLGKSIVGYDITPMMVMLSQVNLFLHNFKSPKIHEYDTLSSDARWSEKFDCILANPPFMTPKGGVTVHDLFHIKSPKAEILFSDYIIEHLNGQGKAGFIVPEGIIFTNSEHYVKLRKWLVEDMGLWAVVSLPAQIFQPYSGVKTSIIFVDRKIAREREDILLLKIENDGFELNTNRKPIRKDDLPEALTLLEACRTDFHTFKAKDSQQAKVKYQLLHRDEFKRLDAYKAATVAFDVLKKQYTTTLKAKEEYEVTKRQKLQDLENLFLMSTGLKTLPTSETALKTQYTKPKTEYDLIKKQYDKIIKAKKDYETKDFDNWQTIKNAFLALAGLTELPDTEGVLKIGYNDNWKQKAVDFGTHLLDNDLPDLVKKELDEWREFSLSFDKYESGVFSKTANYELVQLGEIVEILDNLRKPITKSDRNQGMYPYYGATGILDYVDDYIFNERLVLIGEDGAKWASGDKTAFIAEGKYWVNNHAHVVKPHFDKIIDTFLIEILNNCDLSGYVTGVTVPKLNQEKLRQILIPLPPLNIQAQIVAEIVGYQKVIDGCKLIIKNYLPQFEVDESWEMMKLPEVCQIKRGKFSHRPRNEPKFFTEGKYPFIQTGDVVKANGGKVGYKQVLNDLGLSYTKLFKPTIVLLTIAANIGDVAILDYEACFTDSVVGLTPFENVINPYYLALMMQTKQELLNKLAPQSAQKNINVEILNTVEILVPPLSIQAEIVAKLEKERAFIEGAKAMQELMESKITAVIGSLWGKG